MKEKLNKLMKMSQYVLTLVSLGILKLIAHRRTKREHIPPYYPTKSNTSQLTIMDKEFMSDFELADNQNPLELIGAIDGYCAKCIGKGRLLAPFQNITGYCFEGVSDNILGFLADSDVKNEWKIERIFNKKKCSSFDQLLKW
jgi:hypothetical protein